MRTTESEPASPPPLSPSSDFSLISSLDALSLSTVSLSTLTSDSASTGTGRSLGSRSAQSAHARSASGSTTSSFAIIEIVREDDEQEEEAEEDEDDDEEVVVYQRRQNPSLAPSISGRSFPSSGSVTSGEDARRSIDEFLANPGDFMNKDFKKRLWQSLCYELGLAYFEEPESLQDLPIYTVSSSNSSSSPPVSPSSSRSSTPTPDDPHSLTPSSSSRASTPTQDNPRTPVLSRRGADVGPGPISMPQTLTKLEALLKARGHVNIQDYFRKRAERNGTTSPSFGQYSDLVYPSTAAMCRYTKKVKRFVRIDQAETEALQPLLRTMFFHPR